MELIKIADIDKKIKDSSIAFGVFDGVHLGHKKIIERMMDKENTKKIVLTFYNHPEEVINKESKVNYITTLKQREHLLKELGVEIIVYIDFTQQIKNTMPKDFVKQFILDKFDLKKITVGFNNRFGKYGQGSGELLMQMSKEYNFDVEIVDKVCINDEVISSSAIRAALIAGNVKKAGQMLGRDFSVKSKVIDGKKLGRKLGFPTANIKISEKLIMPKNGVYITKTKFRNKEYFSITNIGINPTFKNHPYRAETYILDFNRNIYEEEIEIFFLEKIRDEKKFESLDELKKQIYNDTNCAKIYISANY